VKIFEIKEGSQVQIADLKGHEGPVWQVAWAHPRYGSILASCSYDRKIILWREDSPGERCDHSFICLSIFFLASIKPCFDPKGTWVKIEDYNNHDSSVNSVCWAPHELGLILAAGSSDGTISVITYTGGVGSADGSMWEAEKIHNAHMIGCNAVSWYARSCSCQVLFHVTLTFF